jgi:hypothetical protein
LCHSDRHAEMIIKANKIHLYSYVKYKHYTLPIKSVTSDIGPFA